MQLISGLFWSLLQTACMTDPETDGEKLFSGLFLNKVNHLLLQRLDVSHKLFQGCSLHMMLANQLLLRPVLKHCYENTLVQLI